MGTFEITYTSSVGYHTEPVGASSLEVAIAYAKKEAEAYGCKYEVEYKQFPNYTKIKKVDIV
jgi:hypothetical protein